MYVWTQIPGTKMQGKTTQGLLINPSEIGNVQIFEGDCKKSKLRYFHHIYNFQNTSKRFLRVVLLYIIIIAAKATYYYYYY